MQSSAALTTSLVIILTTDTFEGPDCPFSNDFWLGDQHGMPLLIAVATEAQAEA